MHAQRMPPHITTPFDDSAAMRLRRMGLLTPMVRRMNALSNRWPMSAPVSITTSSATP